MAKCTGVICPMQYGYKVDECNHTECPYRTEPMTNADRIRAMSDEELARWAMLFVLDSFVASEIESPHWEDGAKEAMLKWLKQPAE